MAVRAGEGEPCSGEKIPETWENTGRFPESDGKLTLDVWNCRAISICCPAFPELGEQGVFFVQQGRGVTEHGMSWSKQRSWAVRL